MDHRLVLLALAAVAAAAVVLLCLYLYVRVKLVESNVARQAMQRQFDQRVEQERRLIEQRYALALEDWKRVVEEQIRQDAVQRSRAVTVGKVTEHLTPYLPGFAYNPRDVRFIGSPVDLLVFDGLDEGELRRVVFVEVKSGNAVLSRRERMVRDAITERAVAWEEFRLPAAPPDPPHRPTLWGETGAPSHD